MAATILIVEDEVDLVETLEYSLAREGFQTRRATDGRTALRLLAEDPLPDVVLLDLMLPEVSGTRVCRQLRADRRTRAVPIIMLTAKSSEVDRVVGFELGADDYVVKPFSVRELVLRIRAVLRRVQAAAGESDETTERRHGRLRVDEEGHRVWVDDELQRLTALEFRLLLELMRHPGRARSRERLLRDVWDIHADVTTRTVDTHIKRLREKLGPAAEYVQTLRGVGYCFAPVGGEDG